jgi:metal-responsive CopG/Arc/MetJ family transcriptional regulator
MEEKQSNPFVGVKFPAELLAAVDKLARTEFMSRSDVIRTLVRERIEERRKAA